MGLQGLQACAGKSDTSSESPHQSVESVISSRIFPNAPSEPNTAAFARAVETGIGVNAIGNVLVAKLPKLVQLTNDVSPEVAAAAALSAEAGECWTERSACTPEMLYDEIHGLHDRLDGGEYVQAHALTVTRQSS